MEAWINAYRRLGHLSAHLNPLEPKPAVADNILRAAHGLGEHSDAEVFHPANFGPGSMTLGEIDEKLRRTYCGRIGADFRDISDIEKITWLQKKMEDCNNQPSPPKEVKQRILEKLSEAEAFEHFLQARFLGQKRFSVEGLDVLIPLLDYLLDQAADVGAKEICIGMAHRGRLNVLAHTLGKSYEKMLKEFEGADFNTFQIEGDVKYHLGYSSIAKTLSGKEVSIFLAPNPSHLEAVNPLLQGLLTADRRP